MPICAASSATRAWSQPGLYFAVAFANSGGTAGVSQTVTVTVRDASGVVDTTDTGVAHFVTDDPNATLPGDYVFTVADAGTATLPGAVTWRTAGRALSGYHQR